VRNGFWLQLSRAAFGVEDAEYFVAEPAVPHACAATLLVEDAMRGKAP
jgi:hypothetical protein